jgi:DNA-directed RNA polymerase subunit L
MTDDEITIELHNWPLLSGQRYIHSDMFRFIIDPINIYSAHTIFEYACDIIIEKFEAIIAFMARPGSVEDDTDSSTAAVGVFITPSTAEMPHCFDIKLVGEDYTIGNIIRYELFKSMYPTHLTFVGIGKFHPHNNYITVRLAYRASDDDAQNDTFNPDMVRANLTAVSQICIQNMTLLKTHLLQAIV